MPPPSGDWRSSIPPRPPAGPVLLALVGSDPVAALGVETGRVVADPFRPTADVVAVLRQAAA